MRWRVVVSFHWRAAGPSPYESQDAREGAKAFAEKRSAAFKGD
jgi:hypothetical protein